MPVLHFVSYATFIAEYYESSCNWIRARCFRARDILKELLCEMYSNNCSTQGSLGILSDYQQVFKNPNDLFVYLEFWSLFFFFLFFKAMWQ